jgi:hypothetical protein
MNVYTSILKAKCLKVKNKIVYFKNSSIKRSMYQMLIGLFEVSKVAIKSLPRR